LTLGFAAALGGGPFAAPAAAQEPGSVAHCTVGTTGTGGTLSATFSGLPPLETFPLFVFLRFNNGATSTLQQLDITTDATGAASTPAPGWGFSTSVLPVVGASAVYRDANGNHRWDPDVDETLFRGQATITECPSSVPAAPK
jgi:hypothetical protein